MENRDTQKEQNFYVCIVKGDEFMMIELAQ